MLKPFQDLGVAIAVSALEIKFGSNAFPRPLAHDLQSTFFGILTANWLGRPWKPFAPGENDDFSYG